MKRVLSVIMCLSFVVVVFATAGFAADATFYKKMKEKQAVKALVKAPDDTVFLTLKRFDPATGIADKDLVIPIDVDSLTREKERLEKELSAIQLLLDDIAAIGKE